MKPKEKALLHAIRVFHDANGYGPSVRDLVRLTGIRSTSNVHYWLRKLRDDGLVTSDDHKARSIRVTGG